MQLIGLTKRYGDLSVLDGFSLTLPERGLVALLGPSGCGKTTLLRIVAGLLAPDAGVIAGGEGRVSFIFQEDRLLPWISAKENVELVLSPEQNARGEAAAMLRRLGLEGALELSPGELSGGMARRVAIARALAYDAPLLLLDEPFKGLDEDVKRQVVSAVLEQKDARLMLMITHDRQEALSLADEVCVFQGPPLLLTERFAPTKTERKAPHNV